MVQNKLDTISKQLDRNISRMRIETFDPHRCETFRSSAVDLVRRGSHDLTEKLVSLGAKR